MNRSEDIKELVGALSKAQGVMVPAKFNKNNPHYKSKYADFTSCMDACRKPLSDNGLSILQFCDTTPDNKLKLVTMLAHTSGQWISSYLPLNDLKTCQSLGSEITYMKRYGLSAMLGIVSDQDEGEDDDGEGTIDVIKSEKKSESNLNKVQKILPEKEPEKPAQKILPVQVSHLLSLRGLLDDSCKSTIDAWLFRLYKIENYEDVTVDIYLRVVAALENAVKFMEKSKQESKELVNAQG